MPWSHRKRARRMGTEYVAVHWRTVMVRDRWRCQICGESTPESLRGTNEDRAPELGHIIPACRGGGYVPDNLRCECRACNDDKLDRLDSELGKPIWSATHGPDRKEIRLEQPANHTDMPATVQDDPNTYMDAQ